MKPTECDTCGERGPLTPVINSISETYLCATCLAEWRRKYGDDPQLDPFARMRARQQL